MKSNIKVILMGCALGLTCLASCTDGYEAEPVEKYTLDYVFSTTDSIGEQARKYLNGMYRILKSGHNRVGLDYLDAASDDAISIQYEESDVYKIAMGQFNANNRVSADMGWGDYYATIREANILIPNIDRVPFNSDFTYVRAGETETDANGNLKRTPFNVTMKAEARFLRAWAYWNLVIRYGGVPMVGDRIFDIEDDLQIPRSSFAECINYIVSELDAIKDDLRGLPMGADAAAYGAVPTREACMAMKSRVLLYAASKLFNEETLEPGNEYVGYPSYDRNRWKLAADAAKEFMTRFSSTFELNSNFRNAFLSFYSTNNREIIWFINGEISGNSLEKNNGPLGFTGNALGQGRTLPSQNLVDAFPMRDGKMPNESSKYTYDAQNPYANRDPRLNLTVLHQGSHWLGVDLAMYQGGGNNPTSSALYSRTGYYMCKFMGDHTGDQTEYQNSPHPWVVFRWAEILLNFAEAQNEVLNAPDDEVYDCLIQLRKRAGIEAVDDGLYGLKKPMTQDEMREVIRNERRIEMAFEEQRYFDIRRWKIADKCFSEPIHGVSIINRDGNMRYEQNDVLNVKWDNRRYLYPIPYNEVVKNSNMVQNPNW